MKSRHIKSWTGCVAAFCLAHARECIDMTRRRWIADEWLDGRASLTGARARHLAKVLRAEPGMRFDVVAGTRVFAAIVTIVQDERVEFALGEELNAEAALPLSLMLAVFKFDRMEWAIEKATELGVEQIVPVLTRRTEKHLAQAAAARVERWRRITQEAAKQSRRVDIPCVSNPQLLKAALMEGYAGTKLLLAENEHGVLLRDALGSPAASKVSAQLTLAIGPEGGWTPEEEALFAESGWSAVSLGPRILRSETAAIAAVAVAAASLLG
jgi:16S rRNA (uracil1498-N3)-methyltransferase